jgi:monoamine oxidase
MAAPARERTEILVVGAGMAGLASARDLAKSGRRVVVLEARERIGGRIHTDRSRPDRPLDLGASWIHDYKGNPLTALAKAFRAKVVVTDYGDQTVYAADGKELSTMLQDALYKNYARLLQALGSYIEERRKAPVLGEPTLVWLISGGAALALEEMSDAEVQAAALAPLRRMFGEARVPPPEAVRITRWGKDPFARGSYSHVRPGFARDDRRMLAEPLGDRVFFAGEATDIESPSTAHGAYASGVRAAKRILSLPR